MCGQTDSYGDGLHQLKRPYAVCVTGDGSALLIADKENNRILQLRPGDSAGTIVAGGRGRGLELNQLSLPSDVCVHPVDGSVVVSDMCNHRVVAYGAAGPRVIAGAGPWERGDAAHQLDTPMGICFDSDGALYVSDSGNDRVQRFAPGSFAGETVASGFSGLHGICVDARHQLYVVDGCRSVVLQLPLAQWQGQAS